MTKIWIMSDLHKEIYTENEPFDMPEADALVIAGDFHNSILAVDCADSMFKDIAIFMVAGNHEHYRVGKTLEESIAFMQQACVEYGPPDCYYPMSFLENKTENILDLGGSGPIRFIGSTLWTDYNLYGTPKTSSLIAENYMNDFSVIKGLTVEHLKDVHSKSYEYIKMELQKPFDGKTVVITHHLPSKKSIDAKYIGDRLNPAFASNADELLELGADLWVHGHTHTSCNYKVGKTRVVCNPRGYRFKNGSYENPNFNPQLVIEI